MAKKFSLWDKRLKEYNKKKNVKDKHYSSFWWDSDWDSDKSSRFGGLGSNSSSSSDMVKLIKLTNYQRAVSNFVKIVTKQDIPVVFGGNKSYTDNKRVVISSDISDKNFDVIVGLALHEGSHIKLTDFKAFPDFINKASCPQLLPSELKFIKSLTNIIEDRRIDNYIFKSSPGYKAYYHKMYTHYFDNELIGKGLLSKSLRDPSNISHYEFHLTNMTNPVFDRNALPGLSKIMSLIDLPNIGRLQSTSEVIDVAYEVFKVVNEQIEKAKSESKKPEPAPANSDNDAAGGKKESKPVDNKPTSQDYDEVDDSGDSEMDGDLDANGSEDATDDSAATMDSLPELTASELEKVNKAFEEQKKFVSGEVTKKQASNKLQKNLEQVSKMGLDVQSVGTERTKFNCIIYNISGQRYFRSVIAACNDYNAVDYTNVEGRRAVVAQINAALKLSLHYHSGLTISSALELPHFMGGRNKAHVMKGMELGALLGRKLMVRNEERSLVYNRLVSGHIDQKRLSHAGYGIETVFKQIHIDRYKQACLHISLDLSGSMSGTKWVQTVQMTSAIVKAATYVQNLRIQVSLRTTAGQRGSKDTPVLIYLYDSKVNDLMHYIETMSVMTPSGTTPEGLCFDALMKHNLIMSSSSECTSYFLNISDGFPGMSGFQGREAYDFTRKMVHKMRNDYGINVLSFYVDDLAKNGEPSPQFRDMYGKDSRKVSANNVTEIARELNAKFLSEGKYTG